MRINGSDAHLTYCLNVHPATCYADVQANIFPKAIKVFKRLEQKMPVQPPYGLGLWVPAVSLPELAAPGAVADLKRRLTENGLYVFTVNGFPFGKFHGARVKERVYQPDWSKPARAAYTRTLAEVLAPLLPDGVEGTISTVPVTFRAWADRETVAAAAIQLAGLAGFLDQLAGATGRDIALALEPEPACYLETAEDARRFFLEELLPRGCTWLGEAGVRRTDAERIIRRRIGVCYDLVHAAVMFEDPVQALAGLGRDGIRVLKLHIGSAVQAEVGADGPSADLTRFNEAVYLHQVTVRTQAGGFRHYLDMPAAIEQALPGTWRVHFHVPHASLAGPVTDTSSLVNARLLKAALDLGVRHFEVETYTLDILPGFTGSVEDAMAREIAWAYSMLSRRE
ncbi:MAG: metabolite traffic protein EboE [Planctomycetota bacterium]